MKNKINKRLFIVSFFLLLIWTLSFFGYRLIIEEKIFVKNIEKGTQQVKEEEEPEVVVPKLKIIDPDSNSRTIAVMIDNHTSALPHAGLQDAYIVYEIIVEGGISRILALFKDKETDVIGPVRSARHYFLDYALEHDAVFVHFGHSPQALSDIKKLKVNNINGIYDDKAFWRDKSAKSPHNAFTSMTRIKETIDKKKYRFTTESDLFLNYSIEELNLAENENAILANNIRIRYSSSHYIDYQYDEENKVYLRFSKGEPHADRVTGAQYFFKNIIVYSIKNFPLPGGKKGRQDIKNIGTGNGYYITNGYAIPITWEKKSRTEPTIYKDMNGEILKVNDGNTFINLQPLNKELTIN